jgi:hypothetical protein
MALLMLVLAFVFMSPGLPPGRVAVPMQQLLINPPWKSVYPHVTSMYNGGDILLQQLPWRHWAQQEFAAGRFPLWASAPAGGMPLLASMQPGVLHPLHLLWVLMPIGVGLGIIMVLKLWLAGLGMWLFLRSMDLSPAAAGLSALGFMFSATMVDWLSWNNSSVYLLLPWIAWAVYAWCRHGRRVALVGLAALVAFAILGGHPETLFNMGVVSALWTLGLLAAMSWRLWASRIAGLIISVAIAAGLGAIQLLPFLQVLPLSQEGTMRNNPAAHAAFHLDAQVVVSWVIPRFWGQPYEGVLSRQHSFYETNAYVGLAALVGLVLVGIAAAQRHLAFRNVVPWVVIGSLAWVLTYDTILGTTIRMLPGFNQSINVRWVWMVGFAALVVSAFGFDWLARRVAAQYERNGERSRRQEALMGAGVTLMILGALVMAVHASGVLPQPVLEPEGPWHMVTSSYQVYWLVWTAGVAAVVLGASVLWASGGRTYRIAPILLGTVLVLDLWWLLFTMNGSAPADQYFPETRFLHDLKSIPSTERIIAQDETLISNSALVYGIRDWRAQDPMLNHRAHKAAAMFDPDLPKRPWDAYNMVFRTVRLELAPMLGIRYYVSSENPNTAESQAPDQPPITRKEYKEGVGLWFIEGVPGFVYLSDNVQAVADEKAAAAWMNSITWAQVRAYAALVEASASEMSSVSKDPAGTSPGGVEVLDYTPGYIRLRAKAVRPALMVVAESWYPGWRAALDGQPVNLLRANYLSQGVIVPQGTHTIELRYSPNAFNYGAIISSLSILGFIGLLLWAWRPWLRTWRVANNEELPQGEQATS